MFCIFQACQVATVRSPDTQEALPKKNLIYKQNNIFKLSNINLIWKKALLQT